MKKLNHYFQKGAIVFVIVMLITIPNLHVFSSIHSYQTSSPAIMANKHYQSDHSRQMDSFILCMGSFIGLGVIFAAPIIAGLAVASKAHFSQPNHFFDEDEVDEVYAKYDFSEFDN